MEKQNDRVVVIKGSEFRLWIGSMRRNGSKVARLENGEITEGCTFRCRGKLFCCKSVMIARSQADQEIRLVARPSDYDSAAFELPEVILL